jgi:hypothetical protein
MKAQYSKFFGAVLVLLTAFALWGTVWAQDGKNGQQSQNETTLIILADGHIREGLWPVLSESLRRESAWESRSAPVGGNPDVVLGDRFTPPPAFPERIQIQLLGRCDLQGASFGPIDGPLGWVLEHDGKIQPDIRVSCARLTRFLEPVTAIMPTEKRQEVVSQAISRIVLHEWIHIATQNAGHSPRGLMQSELTIHDLIAPIPAEGASDRQKTEDAKGFGARTSGKRADVRSAFPGSPAGNLAH